MKAEDLTRRIASLPEQLAVWHAGPVALPGALQILEMRRIERMAREGRHPALVAPAHLRVTGDSTDSFRHATSTLVEWSAKYMHAHPSLVPPSDGNLQSKRGKRTVPRAVSQKDFDAACDLALDWQLLETVITGLSTGDVRIRESTKHNVWFENDRSAAIEALDLQLSLVTVLDGPADAEAPRELRQWMVRNRGRPERLHAFPSSIRRSIWRDAVQMLASQGTTIPEATDLGGLNLAEARDCYAVLIAQLYLNDLLTIQLQSSDTLVWGIRPANLRRLLSEFVSSDAAASFIDLCRFTRGRSAISAPLVPHGELLLIPSALVTPIAFERTLLRAASADPSRVGVLGQILGGRVSRWADRLRTIPGCEVAERLKVRDQKGRLLGDIDLVAWDQSARIAVVFESKWPIDAATLSESFKVDKHFEAGRRQLRALRANIEGGECRVAWPHHWNPEGMRFRWWVASAQQLDSSSPLIDADGVGSTSFRLVESLLPCENLNHLVRRLEGVPLPVAGRDYQMTPVEATVGSLRLHLEGLEILGRASPPKDRRTSAGWT